MIIFRGHRRWLKRAAVAALSLLLFTGGWTASLSYYSQSRSFTPIVKGGTFSDLAVPDAFPKNIDFKLFWSVWDLVKTRSIQRPIDERILFYGALKGIVRSLNDPNSALLDPQESRRFADDLSGEFEGIGAEIAIRNNKLVIVAPLPETPAEKAGLKAGDEVLSIDGKDTSSMTIEDAVRAIRGKRGTVVKLLIRRAGKPKPQETPITRGKIELKSVRLEWFKAEALPKELQKKKIARLVISSCEGAAPSRFQAAVQELLVGGADGVVLDLRNNPGGLLDSAIDVAGAWVDHNLVVFEQHGRDAGSPKTEYRSQGQARLSQMPTVALVNQGSASASEILAGALQEYGNATLVGAKTFGKGSVQELMQLPDGSALKLTIARWLTPHGRLIDGNGIEPNVAVEQPEQPADSSATVRDVQLERALKELARRINKS